jgi:hypothetical protein
VKPGNILVADDGAAMISDFGISHALGDVTLTSTGMVHGTPAYLAPEIARGGEATTASDVFSLGSTLYAAVEGTPPFGTDSNSIGLLHRVAAADFPPPEQAGPLAPLLAEMLSSDPADRPPMGAVAGRLKALAGDPAPAPAPVLDVAPAPAEGATAGTAPTAVMAAATGASAATTGTDADLAAAAPRPRPRRRPARALAAVAALVVAGVLAGFVWVQYGAPGGAAARDGSLDTRRNDPPATGAPTPGSSASSTPANGPSRSPAPGADGSASSTRPPTTRAPSTPPPRPRTSSAPPTTAAPPETREPEPPAAGDPAEAVRSYYALMPAGTDQGWSRMTARYQRRTAINRRTYERFWAQFRRVEVSNVTVEGPDRAVATLTYLLRTGEVKVERTEFRFVEEDGQLKIDRSEVLRPGAG